MDMIYEVQKLRTQLIQEIDSSFEELIARLREDGPAAPERPARREPESYETVYPLYAGPTIFKGRKPTGIIFGDGRRVDVPSWRRLAEVILLSCDSDPETHVKLMNLRGRLSGRERIILAKTPDNMRKPLRISDNLFMEVHYDTETLLRILTTRVLDAVGYDYSGIAVAVRND